MTSNLNTIKKGTIFLTDIQSDFEKIEKRFDFGDIAIVKDVIKNSVLRIKEQKKLLELQTNMDGTWPKNSKTTQLQRIQKKARGSDRQRLGLKGKGLIRKVLVILFVAIANSFNLDMLPTPGSSSTLQAGTTEVRNPDRTEFYRTSVYTVTDSDIGASTVRLKREVRPLENQHQPRPVHREKV